MHSNSYETCLVENRFEYCSFPKALWRSVVETIRFRRSIRELSADIMQERNDLALLPDHILRDIGVDRGEAYAESRRGRYDLPIDRVRQINT